MPDAPPRIFISYSRDDSIDFVNRLEQDLIAQQFHTWVDRHRLEVGDDWLDTIQTAIDERHAPVVILSPAAIKSKYVRTEYHYAYELGKLLIPALYRPTDRIPMLLRPLHRADFHSDYDEGLRRLVRTLSHLKASALPNEQQVQESQPPRGARPAEQVRSQQPPTPPPAPPPAMRQAPPASAKPAEKEPPQPAQTAHAQPAAPALEFGRRSFFRLKRPLVPCRR